MITLHVFGIWHVEDSNPRLWGCLKLSLLLKMWMGFAVSLQTWHGYRHMSLAMAVNGCRKLPNLSTFHQLNLKVSVLYGLYLVLYCKVLPYFILGLLPVGVIFGTTPTLAFCQNASLSVCRKCCIIWRYVDLLVYRHFPWDNLLSNSEEKKNRGMLPLIWRHINVCRHSYVVKVIMYTWKCSIWI